MYFNKEYRRILKQKGIYYDVRKQCDAGLIVVFCISGALLLGLLVVLSQAVK